jgi:shikimate kinase
MVQEQKIILIGPMGAGKTTLGKILAQELGWKYFDNDAEMTSRYGHSQAELAHMSVTDLHALESKYLADVISEPAPFISGAAASVVDYENNRELLKSVTAIYLRIPVEVAIERAGTQGVGRQAVSEGGTAILVERFERRDPLYTSCAKFTIELGNSPEADAKKVLSFLQ